MTSVSPGKTAEYRGPGNDLHPAARTEPRACTGPPVPGSCLSPGPPAAPLGSFSLEISFPGLRKSPKEYCQTPDLSEDSWPMKGPRAFRLEKVEGEGPQDGKNPGKLGG